MKEENILQASLVIRVFAIENSPFLWNYSLFQSHLPWSIYMFKYNIFYMLDSFLSP